MESPTARRPPAWLKYANVVNLALLRLGIGPGSQRILTIPGRTSGLMRSTPVAVLNVGEERFIVAGYDTSDWVKNARAAGWGMLQRGHAHERVALRAASMEESPLILRQFAQKIRGARAFLTVKPDAPDAEFEAAARRHPVFRLETDTTS